MKEHYFSCIVVADNSNCWWSIMETQMCLYISLAVGTLHI